MNTIKYGIIVLYCITIHFISYFKKVELQVIYINFMISLHYEKKNIKLFYTCSIYF